MISAVSLGKFVNIVPEEVTSQYAVINVSVKSYTVKIYSSKG